MKNKSTNQNIKKNKDRRKNPIAAILRTPMFKSKVKPSGKTYSRKK